VELQRFLSDWNQPQKGLRNVIFYYVGHGDLKGDSLYLALPTTSATFPRATMLDVSSLALAFAQFAKGLRWFLILDCCYAGSADRSFQDVAKFSKGIAIFGACLGKSEGIGSDGSADGKGYTLFSGALFSALREGKEESELPLSFQDLRDAISQSVKDTGPLPSLLNANPSIDITATAVFPNPATNTLVLLRALRQRVDSLIVETDRRFGELGTGATLMAKRATELETLTKNLERAVKALETRAGELDTDVENLKALAEAWTKLGKRSEAPPKPDGGGLQVEPPPSSSDWWMKLTLPLPAVAIACGLILWWLIASAK
jgi:hypothetical protein